MENDSIIRKEVNETMNQMNRLETVNYSPNFTSRLLAKIERIEIQKRRPIRKIFLKPVLVPVVFGLVALINITSALLIFQGEQLLTYETEGYLTAYVQEYSLNYYSTDIFALSR